MNQQKNFLDSKTLLSIALMVAIMLGWQYHLSQKYGPSRGNSAQNKAGGTAEKDNSTKSIGGTEAKGANQNSAAGVDGKNLPASSSIAPPQESKEALKRAEVSAMAEQLFEISNDQLSLKISSSGMGFRDVVLKKYTDRQGQPISLTEKGKLFLATTVNGEATPLRFNIEKVSENEFIGRANAANSAAIEKRIVLDPSKYMAAVELVVRNAGPELKTVGLSMTEKLQAPKSSGFLNPTIDSQTLFVRTRDGKSEREVLDSSKMDKREKSAFESISVAAYGSTYFASAFLDASSVFPSLKASYNGIETTDQSVITYPLLGGKSEHSFSYKLFTGPKDLKLLSSVDAKLGELVDFGYFGVIGDPLLRLLKFLHSLFSNWGLAIIGLTILVRLLVLPFNVMSYKSMKAMQKIQPMLQALKEKYKNDPQTLNTETMNLFKTHKVNPAGGCLPALLQLPVFFALYRVLGNSIELYQAPFGLWITDLSAKDPFYVLPVLMGISMFLQQKMTPTTMDPAQAKVLMFMPILMSFMMLTLPSGLTLYIFVSTVFGIVQQMMFMRDKSTETKPVVVKA